MWFDENPVKRVPCLTASRRGRLRGCVPSHRSHVLLPSHLEVRG